MTLLRLVSQRLHFPLTTHPSPLPTSALSSASNSSPNNTMITHLLALLVGFVAGALVFRKHAAKASELEAKGRQALDALKGRD